jgi:hypothetical protein
MLIMCDNGNNREGNRIKGVSEEECTEEKKGKYRDK